mgnify:CR=1 FL=1
MNPKTICINCKHFIYIGTKEFNPNFWHYMLCKKSPIPEVINPVTGIKETSNQYNYCKNINFGDCSLYEGK